MGTIDGYTRAALVIRELPLDEQAWILDALEEHDRARVTAALQSLRENGAAGGATAAPAEMLEPPPQDQGDAAFIGSVAPDTLAAVLDAEPDWVAAIVVAECPNGEAVRGYLAELPVDRIERLRVVARHVRESVKPKVREVVLQRVAERLRRERATQAQFEDFEQILRRASRREAGEEAGVVD